MANYTSNLNLYKIEQGKKPWFEDYWANLDLIDGAFDKFGKGYQLIQDVMNRTYYIDAVNGDDNNDGSSSHPFKTIQKAVDSAPVGGFVYINLVNDYTGVFYSCFRNIYINISSGKTWTISMGNRCDITGNNITILNHGSIVIDKGDGSNITGNTYAGFWVSGWETNFGLGIVTNLYLVNYNTTNPVRVDSRRCLFGSRTIGTNQNIQINLVVYNIYSKGNFVLDGNLMQLINGCGSFQWNNLNNDSSFQVVDSNGNAVDIKTKIAGIIKDSNGVPRNIMSNLIL